MAGVAANPQEAMFQTAAFEVIVEFLPHITRQLRALLRQMGGKHRVMMFDDSVEKCLFRLVALVTVTG